MSFNKRRKRHIGDDVAIANNNSFIFNNKVFDIFDTAGSIKQNRLVSESNRNAFPIIFWKYLGIFFSAVMSIDDKSPHTYSAQLFHRVSNNRTSAYFQKRLGYIFAKRP